MDIAALFAEAEKITDPVEREKELNRISSMILGSPARAAVTPATASVVGEHEGVIPSRAPTVESAANLERLVRENELTDKLSKVSRMDAMSDDELEQLVNGFSSTIPPEAATEEIAARDALDKQSTLENLLDPKALTRKAGQVVAGAAEIPTSGPVALAGILGKGLEFVTQQPLLKDTEGNVVTTADDILKAASEISGDVRSSVGIGEPRNIGESMATMLPSLIGVPGKVPSTILGNAAELLTPLVIGGGLKRVAANFATGLVADQAFRELVDTEDSDYKTIFDETALTGKDGVFPDISSPETASMLLPLLGIMAGSTIVTPIVAQTMKAAKANLGPTVRDIIDIDLSAPKGLKTLETAGDLYKTYAVDEKSVLSGLAKRAGIADYDLVSKMIDQDTQMSAVMKINEAMRTGQLATTGGTFNVKVTPDQLANEVKRLPPAMQEDADMYMKLLDFSDDLNLRINKNVNATQAQQQLQQVQQSLYDIEQRTPMVKDISKTYQSITEAVRGYLGQGPNAMLSPKALQALGVERKNYVPLTTTNVNPGGTLLERLADAGVEFDQNRMDDWYLQNRDIANINSIAGRGNAFEVLQDYVRNSLKSKMEHDVRGAYIRSMQQSNYGGETLRPVGKDEVGKYRDRLVEVYENGEKKQYLSSKLQAELLKFDPYVAKFPNMYYMKRLFERGTTGALSLTFAPITMLRDSLGGWVFMPKNMKGPIGPELVSAVPKMAWAKTQLAAIDILKGSMKNIPFINQQQRDTLAQQISNSYMNSVYHLANEVGGFDASLMKTNIENARGIMHEIAKGAGATASVVPGAVATGKSLRALAHGFSNIFDAIQEAPRFATFERNLKAGMSAADASREAKKLTGDTTRSGRVYNTRGVRIDADAINKGAKASAPLVGRGIEFFRETTPYFNPMVQGMRRMGEAFIDDPIKTNLRAWTAVGLPAMTFMGWNEMLGPEYNEFAFKERSSRDIAMNLYLGIPGLPPEQGIQIPIPHELTLFNSPWTTGLYAYMKGAEGDEVEAMVKHMASTALENSAMVGFPQVGAIAGAAAGVKTPSSINPFAWKDDTYSVTEDNVGFFPQNVELLLRNTFGAVADTAMQTGAAMWDGGPEAFFDELGNQVTKKLPVVKNLAGTTTPVTNFTPLSKERQNKVESLNKFFEMYEEHLDPRREGRLRVGVGGDTKGLLEDSDAQTTANFAPLPTPKPTNPIAIEYGDIIKSVLDSNDEGYGGLKSRYSILTDQLRLLRGYNAGRADDFATWQKTYKGKDAEYQNAVKELEAAKDGMNKKEYAKQLKQLNEGLGELAKADRLTRELKIDMKKRSDVTKLVGALERERMTILTKQLSLIEDVENRVTRDLVQRGMMPPGQKFDVTKHLGVNAP